MPLQDRARGGLSAALLPLVLALLAPRTIALACESWCTPMTGQGRSDHCDWCACSTCAFCDRQSGGARKEDGPGSASAASCKQACTSTHAGDVKSTVCEAWCDEAQVRDHCTWCKCRGCLFCGRPLPLPPNPPPMPPVPPIQPQPSPPPWLPGREGVIYRLTARGTQLVDNDGRSVVLNGVNTYLEWYRTFYDAPPLEGSSALDIAHLRRALPAANCIRFVALLWKDSIKESDGLECSTGDASHGFFSAECLKYVDEMVRQATEAGLWVIIAARSKYAAGWGGGGPDVWHSHEVRRQMISMWRFIANRYKHTNRIAGCESNQKRRLQPTRPCLAHPRSSLESRNAWCPGSHANLMHLRSCLRYTSSVQMRS